MNILMLTPLYSPHIGGVETHVKQISKTLLEYGYKVSIITMKHNPNLPDSETLEGIKIFRINKNLSNSVLWKIKYFKVIKNADIVHCHDFNTFIFWYLPFMISFPLKPVYITFHGHEGVMPISKLTLFFRKVSERLTAGNICIGDFILKWYGTKANFVSYGGVEKSAFSNEKVVDDSVIFVGRLEVDTGIISYIKAIEILKNKYNMNINFDICGDGKLRKLIEKEIEANQLNINLHGFVENPNDYLIRSKFAFVSGYLSILEAMICKKLVFNLYENELKKDYLTLIPGSENIMITASTPEELAEKINYYCSNPERVEEKIGNAYRFAEDQTWEKVTRIYLKLWGIENEQN